MRGTQEQTLEDLDLVIRMAINTRKLGLTDGGRINYRQWYSRVKDLELEDGRSFANCRISVAKFGRRVAVGNRYYSKRVVRELNSSEVYSEEKIRMLRRKETYAFLEKLLKHVETEHIGLKTLFDRYRAYEIDGMSLDKLNVTKKMLVKWVAVRSDCHWNKLRKLFVRFRKLETKEVTLSWNKEKLWLIRKLLKVNPRGRRSLTRWYADVCGLEIGDKKLSLKKIGWTYPMIAGRLKKKQSYWPVLDEILGKKGAMEGKKKIGKAGKSALAEILPRQVAGAPPAIAEGAKICWDAPMQKKADRTAAGPARLDGMSYLELRYLIMDYGGTKMVDRFWEVFSNKLKTLGIPLDTLKELVDKESPMFDSRIADTFEKCGFNLKAEVARITIEIETVKELNSEPGLRWLGLPELWAKLTRVNEKIRKITDEFGLDYADFLFICRNRRGGLFTALKKIGFAINTKTEANLSAPIPLKHIDKYDNSFAWKFRGAPPAAAMRQPQISQNIQNRPKNKPA